MTAVVSSLTAAPKSRLYVLDTNVLMHDPSALFRFQEHDIFLPMVVLEELDQHKKGLSEQARNVRQVSRTLDDLLVGHEDLEVGLPLPHAQGRLLKKKRRKKKN
jgi:PhoH-like ATPase